MGTTLLILVKDLLLSSRVTTVAKSLNIPYTVMRNPSDLADQAASMLIVDLNLPGAIEAASNWQRQTSGSTVGFVAHTDAATIAQARTAGIQLILARSKFVEDLPQLLASS
jgi:hypothetical protein